MYGNNMGGPFMMPNTTYGPMMGGFPMMRGASMMRTPMMGAARGGGLGSLFGLGGRSGASLLGGARSLNFAGLLSNASKALGVVNQAIPIVKEVGPMLGNMKSMLRIASVFKDETDTNIGSSNVSATNDRSVNTKQNIEVSGTSTTKEKDTSMTSTHVSGSSFNNEPNFFL